MQEAVGKLSAADQRLVKFLYYEKKSFDEITILMGKSRDALYMQHLRIKEKLEHMIKNNVSFGR
jgi:hypothetical protein